MTAADDPLLLPWEAARYLQCSRRTLARWSVTGRVTSVRTPGGHRRYRWSDLESARLAARGRGR